MRVDTRSAARFISCRQRAMPTACADAFSVDRHGRVRASNPPSPRSRSIGPSSRRPAETRAPGACLPPIGFPDRSSRLIQSCGESSRSGMTGVGKRPSDTRGTFASAGNRRMSGIVAVAFIPMRVMGWNRLVASCPAFFTVHAFHVQHAHGGGGGGENRHGAHEAEEAEAHRHERLREHGERRRQVDSTLHRATE